MKINFRSPYFAMSLVIAMYVIKVFLKIGIGLKINSVSIYSDGLHNLADIFEALLVIFAIYLSRQPESSKYPIGKSSIEALGSLLIGIVVVFIGGDFLLKSLLGLLTYFNLAGFFTTFLQQFMDVPARINLGGSGTLIVILLIFSVITSWIVSYVEINTGKKKNHQSLVSDGRETFADSFIEMAVLVGVIGVFFKMFYLDYIFGIVVAIVILRTGIEMLRTSFGNLLQKSINQEEIQKIREILLKTKGVESVGEEGFERVMAYRLGKFTFISMKIYVSFALSQEGFYLMKKAIQQKIKETITGSEIKIYFRHGVVAEKARRAIIPVNRPSKNPLNAFIEEDFAKAKDFYIADLKGDRIVSVNEHRNNFKSYEEIIEFVKRKRIDVVYYVNEDKKLEKLLPKVKFEKTSFLIFKDMFH
jgi:cation diffusion facilitator family transporter